MLKVGGSLLDWPELPDRLAAFVTALRNRGCAPGIVVGGGMLVDQLRVLDARYGLGDERAHRLALRAMDWTGFFLGELLDGRCPALVEVAHSRGMADRVWRKGGIPVILPRRILAAAEQRGERTVAHTWDATSDSIAAWLARTLGARELILLKSTHAPAADWERLLAAGYVDRELPEAARGLRVRFVPFRSGDTEGTVMDGTSTD